MLSVMIGKFILGLIGFIIAWRIIDPDEFRDQNPPY